MLRKLLTITAMFLYQNSQGENNQQSLSSPCNNFNLVTGNPYNSSTTVMLELHNKRDMTNECLDKLTNNVESDIILVEAAPHCLLVPCSDAGIIEKSNFPCVGWNNEEILKKSQSETISGVKVEFASLYQEKTKGMNDKDFLSYLNNQKRIFQKKNFFEKKLLHPKSQYKYGQLIDYTDVERQYLLFKTVGKVINTLIKNQKKGMARDKSFSKIISKANSDSYYDQQERSYYVYYKDVAHTLETIKEFTDPVGNNQSPPVCTKKDPLSFSNNKSTTFVVVGKGHYLADNSKLPQKLEEVLGDTYSVLSIQ